MFLIISIFFKKHVFFIMKKPNQAMAFNCMVGFLSYVINPGEALRTNQSKRLFLLKITWLWTQWGKEKVGGIETVVLKIK